MVISKHILTDYINNHDMMWLIMMRNESKRWYIILLILDGKEYYSLCKFRSLILQIESLNFGIEIGLQNIEIITFFKFFIYILVTFTTD